MGYPDPFVPYGIARTADLVRHSWSRRQIARKVAGGAWLRVSRGWIGNGLAEPAVEAAVRAGGALSCVSALRRHDVWVPPDPTVHLRYSDHRRRKKPGIRSCAPAGRPLPVPVAVDGIRLALESAAGCLRGDELTAVLDSALNKRLVSITDLEQWFGHYPHAVRKAVGSCDPMAESGTESLTRLRLRRRQIGLRAQVEIAGVGRVDLLVGDRLVIELDSKAHHTSLASYASDRARDRRLRALGYQVIRLTYEEVMYGWVDVEPDILAMIRRGDHRWPRTKLRKSGPRDA